MSIIYHYLVYHYPLGDQVKLNRAMTRYFNDALIVAATAKNVFLMNNLLEKIV